MPKSQAELDRAVIEAAERWEQLRDLKMNAYTDDSTRLIAAVRARREAMRQHKAAVLRAVVIENHGTFGCQNKEWNELPDMAKNGWRALLNQVLSAPDEPEGGQPDCIAIVARRA